MGELGKEVLVVAPDCTYGGAVGIARGRLSEQEKAARRAARAVKLSVAAAAWARATILLSRDEFDAAVVAGVEAFASARPRQSSHRGQMVVFGCADVPVGWCFMKPGERVAVVNLGVWKRHCCSPALYEFANRGLALTSAAWGRFDLEDWDLAGDISLMAADLEPFFYERPLT